jgi:SAM-dependent methyltransferase
MAFGYLPDPVMWRDRIQRMIGYPSLIRRLQGPVLIRLLSPRTGDSILDAGCGIGYLAVEISRRGGKALGIDISLSRRASYISRSIPLLDWTRGDVQQMPFANGVFDKVLLSSVIQMVPDDIRLLEECRRVLKTKGILVISLPLDYIHYSWLNKNKDLLRQKFGATGKAIYREADIVELLRKTGFSLEEKIFCPGYWGSWFYETLLLLAMRFRLSRIEWVLFPLLFPLVKTLSHFEPRAVGNELVIKARRI